MGDFFAGKHFRIIAGVAVALVILIIAGVSSGLINQISTGVLEIVALPFQKLSATLANGADDFFSYFQDTAELKAKIETLEEQNRMLTEQIIDYENVKRQNEQYEEMLGIAERHIDWDVAPGAVIQRDPNERFHSFTIDIGSFDGVTVGDPVVAEGGLIGVVSDVGPMTSKVQTILDAGIKIGASETSGRYTGIITGSATLAAEGEPRTQLTLIRRESILYEGHDIIKTSGIGGRYPSDIVIGTVVAARSEPNGVSMTAIIAPAVDILSVRNVFVIKDFEGKGSEIVNEQDELDILTDEASGSGTGTEDGAAGLEGDADG